MLTGYILWFDHRDGYGIIKTDEGVEYYTDVSALDCDPRDLKHKVKVTFVHNTKIKDCRCGTSVKLAKVS